MLPDRAPPGYGRPHRRVRERVSRLVALGAATCARCGELIRADQEWDLGHQDHDRSRYSGPEHRHSKDCPMGGNRATARHRAGPERTSRTW